MDPRSLRHFSCVVDSRSFSRAAVSLGLTQSALSKSVRRLEDELGVQLLERGPGGVSPTAYGLAVLDHARAVEIEGRNLRETIDALRGTRRGEVTVGAGPSIMAVLIAPVVMRFLADRPEMRVTAVEGMIEPLIPALRAGRIDFTVGSADIGLASDDLVSEPLFEDEISVVARTDHPLRRLEGLRLSDLLGHPWVLPLPDELFHLRCAQCFRAQGLAPPQPQITTNSTACIRDFVARGGYLSFLPHQLIRAEIEAGMVAPLEVPGGSWTRRAHVLRRRRGALSPSAQELIARLKATCRDGFGPEPEEQARA